MRIETKKAAAAVVGGLSRPGKMPCPSFSIPAISCNVGAVLANVENSTCSDCYAMKGRYRMSPAVEALKRRLDSLRDPRWVDAMVTLIKGLPYFRWFDSGDLQGQWHLDNILDVVRQTPGTKHWLPTREYGLIRNNLKVLPETLTVRVSTPMVDQAPILFFPHTSTVHDKKDPVGHACPAYKQGGKCGDCRACWDKGVKNVSYPKH